MAITASTTKGIELTRMASGSHLDDAGSPAAASVDLGFLPRYIRVDNVTDRTCWEWYQGMTSDYAVQQVAAGTTTLLTTGGITVSGDTIGWAVTQNKQYRWYALG